MLTEFPAAVCPSVPSLLLPTSDVAVAPFGVSFPPSLPLISPLSLVASSPNEHRFPVMALQRERGEGETVNTLATTGLH